MSDHEQNPNSRPSRRGDRPARDTLSGESHDQRPQPTGTPARRLPEPWTCLICLEGDRRLSVAELDQRVRAAQQLEPFDIRLAPDETLEVRLLTVAHDAQEACRNALALALAHEVVPQGVYAARCTREQFEYALKRSDESAAVEPSDDPAGAVDADRDGDDDGASATSGPLGATREHLGAGLDSAAAPWPHNPDWLEPAERPVLCLVRVDVLMSTLEESRREQARMGRLCCDSPRMTRDDFLEGHLVVMAKNAEQACERATVVLLSQQLRPEAVYAAGCSAIRHDASVEY